MQSAGRLSDVPQRLSVTKDQVTVGNVLLATDFSECSARALEFALGIASRYESQLHLFHCIDPAPYSLADPDVVWKTRDDAQSELERLVSRLRDQGRASNLEVKVRVDVGDLSGTLPQAVKDLDLDLIVVGTHGRTGWKKLVLGSVAEVVMDHVSCPVLTVGPSSSRTRMQKFGPENIVLVSEASARSQLAEKYAFSLARKYCSRLTLIDVLENRSGRVVAEVTHVECSQSELSESSPNRELTSTWQLPTEIGTQSDLVLQVADRTAADLVVLVVPESHRFTERLVSTNSYRVVCGAPCPVLTVRTR